MEDPGKSVEIEKHTDKPPIESEIETQTHTQKPPDTPNQANEEFETQINELRLQLEAKNNELQREVERRCNLEQRFTDAAKQSTDRIKELVEKSDQDDIRLSDLKKKFEMFTRETSSMIENFTTNREVLTSQLLELRQENDYLLGKFISRSRDMQSDVIDLPQTIEELQFLCLTLNEKLILVSSAKEQLEETLMQIK